jgi:hypothetical protein
MLRVPRMQAPGFPGGRESERIIMGNRAAAEEMMTSDDLEELYGLDASESAPEDDEDDEDPGDDEDDPGDDDGDDDEGIQPEEMPHG